MIVVVVELWPHGDESKARPLGSLALANVTQPGDLLDSYRMEMDEAGHAALGIPPLKKVDLIQGHNRKQSVWKLVKRAIDKAFPQLVLS